ncbi:MAG: monovalent cation/H+ antiporter subunit D [Rhizobiales bacterium]|nr:monovalent cation/H+ antiporter subunit D [Hyphomicrobiales bacterium]
MMHLPIMPILVPLIAAIACMAAGSLAMQRRLSFAAALAMFPVAIFLLASAASDNILVYVLGSWPAPFGIILVADRLSALMVTLSTLLAALVLCDAAGGGTDAGGRHFHALFQFQIAGINGAFLTGDLFNLFVFFEILLLASYGLLAHGHGREKARASLAYVVLNLSASVLFLIAVALLYGTLGTLNLADMARAFGRIPAGSEALAGTAVTLLFIVFALKAALLPLCLWLPRVYSAASAPVAALFAIMTKVGIYCILRMSTTLFTEAPAAAGSVSAWLMPLAIGTVVIGAIGVLASGRLAMIIANLVVVSTGVLLVAIATGTVEATAAGLYYLPHTTLATAAFFLLAAWIGRQRGEVGDALVAGPALPEAAATGTLYLILAVTVSGMPPFSGFIGKLMVLQSIRDTAAGPWAWVAILASGLVAMLVLARTASLFFWEPRAEAGTPIVARSAWQGTAILLLVLAGPLLAAAASPLADYALATARQLHAGAAYGAAVFGAEAGSEFRRPQ